MRTAVIAAAVAALALSSAAAQDKCLTGASMLADQRALASLRAATETACPCARFTSATGATAGAYQTCARAALTNAIKAGDLRQQCKKTATTQRRSTREPYAAPRRWLAAASHRRPRRR